MADTLKSEDGPNIKPDPAVGSPKLIDEEQFEDTGELKMSKGVDEAGAWLAKVPKWLWEAWSQMAEDGPVQLGEVRVYNKKDNEPVDAPQRIKIVLNDMPAHAEVPKKYDVNMTKTEYNNTVVFSEQDQPGYKAGQWNRDRRLPRDRDRDRDFTKDPYRVSKKPYRSSIPKQTELQGYMKHEVNVTAVENDEYMRLMSKRWADMNAPKHTTTFTTGIDRDMHNQVAVNQRFTNFVQTGKAGPKKRTQQDKAVRVSEPELLDLLVSCFSRFAYWSLQSLRAELKQPEAFIKSTLEKVGEFVKSGRFANHYKLSDVYAETMRERLGDRVKQEAGQVDQAQLEEGDVEEDDGDEGDEGGDDDFEDVKMES